MGGKADKKISQYNGSVINVSAFVLCSPKCLSFICSFPDQLVGLPTLAQDISTTFQTATLKPEKDILLAVSGPSKLAQTWEVRTDEILI